MLKSALSPSDAAWLLLKEGESQSLEDILSPEDHHVLSDYHQRLSPEKKYALDMMSQLYYQIPDEQRLSLIHI